MRRLPSAGDGAERPKVELPDADLQAARATREDLPADLLVDQPLATCGAGGFGWLLSLTVVLDALDEDGLPTSDEREVVDDFSERLAEALLDLDETQPPDEQPVNALFLARVDWNGTRELVFRVVDPEVADDLLAYVVESGDYPRPFAYRLDPDPDGEAARAFALES